MSQRREEAKSGRGKAGGFLTALKYLFVAGLLAWLFTSGRIRLDAFSASTLLSWPVAAGAGLLLTAMLIAGLRQWVVLRPKGVQASLPVTFQSTFAGFFFTYCTTGALTGDVSRALLLVGRYGHWERITAAIIFDRAMGLASLLSLCAASLLLGANLGAASFLRPVLPMVLLLAAFLTFALASWLWAHVAKGLGAYFGVVALLAGLAAMLWTGGRVAAPLTESAPPLVWLVVCAASCAAGVALARADRISWPERWPLPAPGSLAGRAFALVQALAAYRHHPGHAAAAFFLALSQHLTSILGLYCATLAVPLAQTPDLAGVFFAAPLTFLFSILPTPGAGIGLHETAYDALVAVALSSAATPPGPSGAAAAYLLFRLLMTALSLLGIPGFLNLRRSSSGKPGGSGADVPAGHS